jgi:uncharacterized membrane protein YraQ (UPF0718 family)
MEQFRIFSSIAAAIFIEAMPFLALGALLSGAIEVLVPPEKLIRRIPKNLPAGLGLGIAAGVVLPTCECGVVPVVRRLMGKGVPAHIAIAYMLSAPILNPVVLVSTYVAFRGSILMLVSRAAVAVIVSGAIGTFVWWKGGAEDATRGGGKITCDDNHSNAHEHEHAGHSEAHGDRSRLAVTLDILRHAAHDFIDMGKYLILGALAAAAFKTFLPQVVFDMLSDNLVLSIGGMMALAFLLSVCSEADAFVAASFAGLPAAAHLAFVTFGPMLDLKLVGMYAATFRRSVLLALFIGPAVMIFLLSLIHGLLF